MKIIPKTIKELVINEVIKLNPMGGDCKDLQFPEKDPLEELVKNYFPNSKWKGTHYSWYKSHIKKGTIPIDFMENEIYDSNEIYEKEGYKEISLSLEKDLHSYLSLRLDEIEEGLELIDNGLEFQTAAGNIDILAKDKNNNYVVIELKARKAKDSVIGQTLGYIGALSLEKNTSNVRGIIVASDFENRLLFAAKSVKNLQLIKYGIAFNFSEQIM